ncbi:MAG TPA: YfcE family phosphodiesterase [Oscillospiraceae bacterium]|nr:YfcE family phosphodiesterase [Oscillospiraceae bacterium]HPF55033.1 YfcE family phosphodiesterase [Clostridiales bacterium]HPK35797.1 YfcE family phosphodiesterase [Oscillospiraceae bacterium]HPR75417.1 YfcE family phosphodiesterase [Oscillospiraceae bacterium]
MKIVVMSDSHGNAETVEKVIAGNPDTDGFYHLGDGWRDFAFTAVEPGVFKVDIIRIGVKGNCDMGCELPHKDVRTLEGVKIAAAHGEDFHGLSGAVLFGAKEKAKVVLHGHTHIPNIEFVNGVWVVCPGTLKYGGVQTYAVLEIRDGTVKPDLIRL